MVDMVLLSIILLDIVLLLILGTFNSIFFEPTLTCIIFSVSVGNYIVIILSFPQCID